MFCFYDMVNKAAVSIEVHTSLLWRMEFSGDVPEDETVE